MPLLILFIALVYFIIQWRNLKKELEAANAKIAALEAEKTNLITQVNALSKYQQIIDAEKEARRIISEANRDSERAVEEAKQVRSENNKAMQEAKAKAEALILSANSNAGRIIDEAHKEAEKVAGDAYKAMKNVEEYERNLRAIENVIKGYGNQYIVPTFSLLDELAEEFGSNSAAERLKQIREQIRIMVKNRTAAKCDYAEQNRRDTAIDFVVDAFNGKVDSILANVKHDNFGTLEQKIKDAYQLVNLNGMAFRGASINREFLFARLQELKFAVILSELKFKEREEQRRIKEEMREEEKARREYEKQLKEAEKQEEAIRKAIEKVQKDVSKANDEQKAMYESQLQELMSKLKEAEEKNQRALSMAQQTKVGNVYIISNIGSFGEDVFKIGMTRRLEPLDRVKELGDASVPFEFDVHAMIYSEDAPKLEHELHKIFIQSQVNKVNPRKEFFRVSLSNIKQEIEKLGIDARWTLAAEAREWRESLAIEKAMQTDENLKKEWTKHQLETVDSVPEIEEQ